MFQSILNRIAAFSVENADRLCIADEKEAYTYGETVEMISRAAFAMKENGVASGDRVAVCCVQNSRFLIAFLACGAIGAISVPIEREASPSRIVEILSETSASLVVCSEKTEIPDNVRRVSYDELFENDFKKCIEHAVPSPDDISEILFTTGSTGKSKGIEITYDNNIALAENISSGTKMKNGNTELIPLPLSHSHALRTFYANMLMNGSVVVTDGVMNVRLIYNLIKKYGVTALDLSPSAAAILLKLSRGKFNEFDSQLDYVELGTAALPESTKEELKKLFPNVRLYNCYGSTESGRTCALDFSTSDDEQYCIGRPSVNAEFIIVDDDRNVIESSPSCTGLIACRGRMNMKGYWKQPELTSQTLVDGVVYTNDEGYISSDGRVFYLGRRGDVINFKGIKIAPDEIEDEVMKSGFPIEDCAVIPEKDETAYQIPVLVLKLKGGESNFDSEGFAAYLNGHIDSNKVPKKVISFNEIPRTYNGKPQRSKLVRLLSEPDAKIEKLI